MAIPIFVPEEYGPLGQSLSPQNRNTRINTSSSDNNNQNQNGSFIHQLILELYTLYQSYNNSHSTSLSDSDSLPVPGEADGPPTFNNDIDPNNNSIDQENINHIRLRRRRHPAERQISVFLCQQQVPVSCPVARTSKPNQNVKDKNPLSELKCSVSEISVGCELRQLADSFKFTFEQTETKLKQRSVFESILMTSSWPVLFLAGAFLRLQQLPFY